MLYGFMMLSWASSLWMRCGICAKMTSRQLPGDAGTMHCSGCAPPVSAEGAQGQSDKSQCRHCSELDSTALPSEASDWEAEPTPSPGCAVG